jgi:hypothetical protein
MGMPANVLGAKMHILQTSIPFYGRGGTPRQGFLVCGYVVTQGEIGRNKYCGMVLSIEKIN